MHTINLRMPWKAGWIHSDLGGKAVRFRRRFNRPTGLLAQQEIQLALVPVQRDTVSVIAADVNGHAIAFLPPPEKLSQQDDPASQPQIAQVLARIDQHLKLANEVVIDVQLPDTPLDPAAAMAAGQLDGEPPAFDRLLRASLLIGD